MQTTMYRVKVKSDSGIYNFSVSASSPDAAKDIVVKAEGCPTNAIKSVKEIGRTIDKIITKVNCQYGAPMGRANVGEPPKAELHPWARVPLPKPKRVYDCAVPMSEGAYDRGGAYWGMGKQLRVRYTKDLSYIEFYRVS